MSEPVAYLVSQEPLSSVRWLSDVKPIGVDDKQITPLYTAEQLRPRVKMTQAEFDEFIGLYGKEYGGRGNVFFGLDQAINLGDYYPYLNKRLITDKQFDDNFAQTEFVNLWIKFDPSHPEETIEIVPTMKWFVRVDSQIPLPDENIYLDDELIVYPHYDSPKSSAHQFDTKEEAEKWTNPLTEAVQLPVEGE